MATSGLGVLTLDLGAPEVTDTSVLTDLLQSLNIRAGGTNQDVDNVVRRFAGDDILLSIDEPLRHLELLGVVDDGDELLDLFVGKSTSSSGYINFGLLADGVGESSTNTGDLAQSVHDLSLTINVGIEHTQNVLELVSNLKTLQNHNDKYTISKRSLSLLTKQIINHLLTILFIHKNNSKLNFPFL